MYKNKVYLDIHNVPFVFLSLSNCYFYTILYTADWLVVFYGISILVGYLMPNPIYTYILNVYDLVSLGFMTYLTL